MLLPIPPTPSEWHALRDRHVGASEVASLFGVQPPYMPGVYALWMHKAGRVPLPPDMALADQQAVEMSARNRKHRRAVELLMQRGADPCAVAVKVGIRMQEACMLAGRLRMGLSIGEGV